VRQYFGDAKPQPICDGSSLERESDFLWDKLHRLLQTLTTGLGSRTVAPGKAALIVGPLPQGG
jgi:hypothetical protein